MTQSDIRKIQNRFCDMAKVIADILETNGIPYIITFGTLLGAVRHKGFIPWDYDFDFCLFDDTYEKAMGILRASLPSDMFLEDAVSEPLFFHGWSHIKDLNTQIKRNVAHQDDIYSHKGLSVDLYRCKKMKMNELCEYRKQEAKAYLERKFSHDLITQQELEQTYNTLCSKIDDEEKETLNSEEEVFGMALNERYMKCSDVFPLKRYQYEQFAFYGPNNADAILTHFYDDYMTPPKEEDRVLPYEVIFKE